MYQHRTSITTNSVTNNPASQLTNTARAERRFCLNASCLTDEILVRKVSSFKHVWLLTDASDNTSWLVNMETPVCPCCDAKLQTTSSSQRLLL